MSDDLVEHARASLARVSDWRELTSAELETLAPSLRGELEKVAAAAEAARTELDTTLERRPWKVGVAGDSRRVIDAACSGLLGANGTKSSPPGPTSPSSKSSVTMRVRRGEATWFRAVRLDGSVEERTMPESITTTSRNAREPSIRKPITAITKVDETALELARLEESLPKVVRERPAWWAIWMWPIRWIFMFLYRDKLVAMARLRDKPAPKPEVSSVSVVKPVQGDTPERFAERLRVLASGQGEGEDVRGILVEVATIALPEEVELAELDDLSPPASFDEILDVTATKVVARNSGTKLASDEAIARLESIARSGRIRGAAARVAEVLRTSATTVDRLLDGVEAKFKMRIATLEALQIADRAAFATREFDRVQSAAFARVTGILEHLATEVRNALAQVETIWTNEIVDTNNNDELKAAIARIYNGSANSIGSLVDATHDLAVRGLADSLRVLHPQLLENLCKEHGLPANDEPHRAALAVLSAETRLPMFERARVWSLGEPGGNWFTGLFKSFDAKRSTALAKVKQGVAGIRELVLAEVLDAEPVLHTSLASILELDLRHAIDAQIEWLATSLAREHAEIAAERERLVPLQDARRRADDDAAKLVRK